MAGVSMVVRASLVVVLVYVEGGARYQYNENGVRLFLDQDEKSGFIPSSDDVNILEDSNAFSAIGPCILTHFCHFLLYLQLNTS